VQFGKIAKIKNKYNNAQVQARPEQLLAAVIRAAPKDCKAVVTMEQRAKGNSVTLADLEEVMHQHWRTIKNNKKEKSEDDEELTLSAFDGKCHNCGKKGHKSADCRSGKSARGKSKKFSGKCNTCGKSGHMAKSCWEDEANAHLRPKG
jgi:Zinc knuckle